MKDGKIIEIGDIAAAIPGVIALFSDFRQNKDVTELSKRIATMAVQQMPKFMGIGRTDERIWQGLLQLLEGPEQNRITLLCRGLEKYEVDILRLILTGIPAGKEVVVRVVKPAQPPQGKNPGTQEVRETKEVSWEFTEKDLRLKTLKWLSEQVRLNGVSPTVKVLRDQRLVARDPFVEEALNAFFWARDFVKKSIESIFNVQSFSEITPELVAEKVGSFADKIPPKGGFIGKWSWVFLGVSIFAFTTIGAVALWVINR